MVDYDWEKKQLKAIEEHFKKKNISYEYIDIDMGNEVVKPAIYTTVKLKGLDFDVYVSAQDVHDVQWIVIRCLVCDLKDLDLNEINKILKIALTVNYYIPETTFSLINDSLFIENDMPLEVSLESFNFEIRGLEIGIGIFQQNMEDLGLTITSTKGILKK
ncbi:MAG: hypothetical protein GF329_08860 [Candidatus Lokiarchaeota archaeon]|nr:hypothetical protein [Candidatus Lokiarchaeota archaeon]